MGAVTPFRDGVEDGGSIYETGNDYADQNKPHEGANYARDAGCPAEEITE
jgi:hypothetical protein